MSEDMPALIFLPVKAAGKAPGGFPCFGPQDCVKSPLLTQNHDQELSRLGGGNKKKVDDQACRIGGLAALFPVCGRISA